MVRGKCSQSDTATVAKAVVFITSFTKLLHSQCATKKSLYTNFSDILRLPDDDSVQHRGSNRFVWICLLDLLRFSLQLSCLLEIQVS